MHGVALLSACSLHIPLTAHNELSLLLMIAHVPFYHCTSINSIRYEPTGNEVMPTLCSHKQFHTNLFLHMCEDEFLKELLGQSARAFVILSKIAVLGGRFTRLLSHQRCVSMLVTPYFCQHGYLIFLNALLLMMMVFLIGALICISCCERGQASSDALRAICISFPIF